jgi:DNA processing protein
MSGISLATAIVEAGETSGALKQADYALKQKRLVFIPQSALDNDKISWPKKYIKREGAAKFTRIEDLFTALEKANIIPTVEEQMSLIDERTDKVYVHQFK